MEAQDQRVPLSWQDGANIVVGQSHFIKTVEDLAEIVNLHGARGEVRACLLRSLGSLPRAHGGKRPGAGGGRGALRTGSRRRVTPFSSC